MTPTKKKRPRRNICPKCDRPTGKASAVHTCKPVCRDCGKVNPADIHSCTPTAIRLQLTDRMKAQGTQATCFDTGKPCKVCGGRMASNGTTEWCYTGTHDA